MIDADDLALLATSFEAAMARAPRAAEADGELHELGWADLLAAAPRQGAAAAFTLLGATGAASCLLDDVVAHALGLPTGPDVCVVLPVPGRRDPAGVRAGDSVRIDGLVSARVDTAERVVVPLLDGDVIAVAEVDAARLRGRGGAGLDPDGPYRRIHATEVARAAMSPIATVTGTWDDAVGDARAALAHQLIAGSRVMLEQARVHAVDRVQFGRSIASFQAVRHRLAEALVAIEGAAAVAAVCTEDGCDPLTPTIAKSVAGKAARTTATHAQQVLAGIGFTTDHPFHRWLKRTMVLDLLFGSARTLPAEIGRSLLAQRGAPRLVEL